MGAHRVVNALTVDVEDYFQVSALAPHVPRSSWDSIPCRVERNVDRLLELFDASDARATFFTLGWVAERYPLLVRRIVEQGHELASHGYGHLRASEQTREELRSDLHRAKQVLEDISGTAVRGYRAPSFSVGIQNLWAFDVIGEAGHSYSSSVYPVKHDHYGMPDSPRFPYRVSGGLLEIPITTVRLLGRNFPAGGGGYFRFLPYSASRWTIEKFNQTEKAAAVFYMHPWEIDPNQPRVHGPGLKTKFRHYVNLSRTEARLKMLLSDFHWDRMDRVFDISK